MTKNNDSSLPTTYIVAGGLAIVFVILLLGFLLTQAFGVFPDSADLTATSDADASATAAVQTANAPTVTNTPSETATSTPTETATMTDTPSDTPTLTHTPSDTPTLTYTPSETASATASVTNSPAPSATPAPTNTTEPSPTPVTQLGRITSSPTEIRFEHDPGPVSFTIESFIFLRELQDYQMSNDGVLVMLGTARNGHFRHSCLNAADLRLILDGQEYTADDALMSLVQAELNPSRPFISNAGGQCLDAGSTVPGFIAFDVPLSAQEIILRYKDAEMPINLSWELLVSIDAETSLEALYAESTPEATAEATETAEPGSERP
jgi:hypothetical protein